MGWGMPERDDGSQEDGPFEERRFNGQLYEKGCYKDGKLDGLYEKYYENGQLWQKGPFKDGRYLSLIHI